MPHYFSQPQETGCEARRGDFQLPAQARWYACQQTLFKIHPDFDVLVGGILRRDPRGIVILFTGQQENWARLLQSRFRASIPDVCDRIAFVPRMPYDQYLAFLRLCDVLLDTVHFCAGTTTYHALALGVPLVTLPGEFARGRGTDAVYRAIGVADCVAADPEDYVRCAVSIANDRGRRDAIGAAFRERMGVLFSNDAAAAEIEAFFLDATRRAEARVA
jgi:predicted O-linked N-acetylglucosamine transferase (SPINDLY family)